MGLFNSLQLQLFQLSAVHGSHGMKKIITGTLNEQSRPTAFTSQGLGQAYKCKGRRFVAAKIAHVIS